MPVPETVTLLVLSKGRNTTSADLTLVVRRIPELNKKDLDQPGLFDLHRFHAVFTTSDPDILDTVAADKTHRQHAVIEQVNADLKASALAHMPSGKFTANASGPTPGKWTRRI